MYTDKKSSFSLADYRSHANSLLFLTTRGFFSWKTCSSRQGKCKSSHEVAIDWIRVVSESCSKMDIYLNEKSQVPRLVQNKITELEQGHFIICCLTLKGRAEWLSDLQPTVVKAEWSMFKSELILVQMSDIVCIVDYRHIGPYLKCSASVIANFQPMQLSFSLPAPTFFE